MAMSGNFGLELDVTKWTAKEKKEVAGYIARYKEIRPLVQFGDFHRLESPYDSDRASWMFVNGAQTEALLFMFQVKPFKKGVKAKPIRLRGLNPTKKYEIQGEKLKLSGKKLMKEAWLPKAFKTVKNYIYQPPFTASSKLVISIWLFWFSDSCFLSFSASCPIFPGNSSAD